MSGDEAAFEPKPAGERRALGIALLLNVGLSVSLAVSGVLADSSALIASALDNTSDAVVFGISYLAVSRGASWKAAAAQLSGGILLLLCGLVLVDVVRRSITGTEPLSAIIVAMTMVSAAVNLACLKLIQGLRHDVNLRAAWTFSINDFAGNVAVLVAGILIAMLRRSWPDLLVGIVIAAIAAKGGLDILLDVRRTRQREENQES